MRATDRWAAVVGLAVLLGCDSAQEVSEPTAAALPPANQVLITGASVDETGGVTVRYTLTQDGQGVGAEAAAALRPTWSLAGLAPDPVSGIPTWQSFLLTGGQTVKSLPIEGPGTPEDQIRHDVKQPGSETTGAVQDLGGGQFSYTFAKKLPEGLDPATTLRAGVWLAGTTGTAETNSTFDFTRSGAAVQARELVLDTSCNQCHGLVAAHGGARTGTKVCTTCHTIQNADPDTVDPAALASANADENPNPLDLGRLVHRIHSGKELPTLHDAESGEPVVGRKYSVVGFRSSEAVYGKVVNRTDNEQPPLAVVEGVGFPQDRRSCQVCHGGAPQADARFADVSRRTCAGCHTDVWFQDSAIPADDLVHRPHSGGPQGDDSRCAACHLATPEHPTVPADVAAIHAAPHESPNWNGLTAQIVGVENMRPGQMPTIVFTLTDRDGTPTPLDTPSPANDAKSPIPRALTRVAITLAGPTVPDMVSGNVQLTGMVPLTLAADAEGKFRYAFTTPLPENAAGTWAIALEARRGGATDRAAWPFTGESLNEWALNPVVYVDTSAGTFPGGAPVSRRAVVDQTKCNACHGLIRAHGDLRNNPEYCVMCHTADATDWAQRPKGATGNTDLAGTYDGLEERSIHFKMMIHRIHTGTHTGAAELGGVSNPMVIYGFRGSVNFLGDVEFPGNLARCTTCHAAGTYQIESVPADAPATVANESATIVHAAKPAHASSEAGRLPVTAACTSCHDTGAALAHAERNTIEGKENCSACHGKIGFMSVDDMHGIPAE